MRKFEKIVWYFYHDLRNEKSEMAGLLSTVKSWFRGFGRRPIHERKKRQSKSQTETSNLPSDARDQDMNPDDQVQVVEAEKNEGTKDNDDDGDNEENQQEDENGYFYRTDWNASTTWNSTSCPEFTRTQYSVWTVIIYSSDSYTPYSCTIESSTIPLELFECPSESD